MAEIGETALGDVLYLCRAARAAGALVAVDVDLDPIMQCGAKEDEVTEVFRTAHLLMPNIRAMETMFPGADAARLAGVLRERFGCAAVVTAGADGCYYADGNGELYHEEAIPSEVTDTVGAGDAFHGGLLYALAAGRHLKEAVRLASFCGAFNCRTFGAREGMARREDVPGEMLGGSGG